MKQIRTMPHWYYELNNETVGPIAGKQLLQLVRRGEIAAGTPIRNGRFPPGKWELCATPLSAKHKKLLLFLQHGFSENSRPGESELRALTELNLPVKVFSIRVGRPFLTFAVCTPQMNDISLRLALLPSLHSRRP